MKSTTNRAALVTLFVLSIAAPVSAQHLSITPPSHPDREWRITPRWDTYAFGGGTSGVGTETRTTSWANVFSAQGDLGFLVLRAAIPMSYAAVRSTTTVLGVSVTSERDQAELGNIGLEGLANIDLGHPDHRLLIGGGLALPTATDPLQRDGTNFIGAAVRGLAWVTSFRNPSAWIDNAFTLWPGVEYRYGGDWLLVTAAASIPVFFPTESRVGGPLRRGNVELMFNFDITGAVRILDILDVGGSFLAWALPSGAGADGDPDLGQTALTLFVRTDDQLDSPVGGGFEMIFNLDNGWGPTGDDGRFWGAHIFLTAKIDG